MTPLLFDSFALLRFLQREPGSEKVRDLLKEAAGVRNPCLLNVINFGEVLYTTSGDSGRRRECRFLSPCSRWGS